MNAVSLAVRETERALDAGRTVAKARHGDLTLEAYVSGTDLWVGIGRKGEDGALGWRVSLITDDAKVRRVDGEALIELEATSPLGRHTVTIEADPTEAAMFVLTARFRPSGSLHVPYLPRDLVVLGPAARPDRPRGKIEARQRRLNTGLCYFSLDEPDFGKVLYVQATCRKTRMPTRSIAGICTIRCAILPIWRSTATRMRANCSST